MPSKPAWTGVLKFAQVTCAVVLHPATTQAEKIRFHYVNRETGNRLRQQYVDEVTGEIVPSEDRVRGYQAGDGSLITLTEAELDQIALPSARVIDIARFIPIEDVDRVYADDCFFVAPDDAASAEAFALIRDAMRRAAVAGLGSTVIYRREHPVLIEPRGDGLLATTLRHNHEVRDDAPLLSPQAQRPAPIEMVRLAGHVIEGRQGGFEPEHFEDRQQTALAGLLEAKRTGEPWLLPAPQRAPRVISDLGEALRRSARDAPDAADSLRRPARRPLGGAAASKIVSPQDDGSERPSSLSGRRRQRR